MRYYTKIFKAMENDVCSYLSSSIFGNMESNEIYSPNKDYISLSFYGKLNEKLIETYENLIIEEALLREMKYKFRRWYLEQTLEYLRINDYASDDEDKKIEKILKSPKFRVLKTSFLSPAVLEIPESIRKNYEAIEAYRYATVGYREIFSEENYPNFQLNLDIYYKKDNVRPFICVIHCRTGECIDKAASIRLALTRSDMPSCMENFFEILNKVFRKAFPRLTVLPYPMNKSHIVSM